MATFVKRLIKTFFQQGMLQVFPLLHLVTIPSVFFCSQRGDSGLVLLRTLCVRVCVCVLLLF